MRHLAIFLGLLLSVLFMNCTNREVDEEIVYAFQGEVLLDETIDSISNGTIQVTVTDVNSNFGYKKSFRIEPDGTFYIEFNSSGIDFIQFNINAEEIYPIYGKCYGAGMTETCTLWKPGKINTNIKIIATRTPPGGFMTY